MDYSHVYVEEQVAPAMQRAAEASDSGTAARALSKQRERMFEALVARGNELAAQLGADVPHTDVRAVVLLPCIWSTSTSSLRRSRVPSPSFAR